MRRSIPRVPWLVAGWLVACAGATPSPAPPPTTTAVRGPRLAPAALRFVEGTTREVLFVLTPDGTLNVGELLVGTLSPEGSFVFAGMQEAVTATLSDGGRVAIAAAAGSDLTRLPGEIGRLLQSYGGRVESGYTIHADGTATIPRGRPLAFDADGRLPGFGLVVEGLTPETRRTAMFVYVLLTTIVP